MSCEININIQLSMLAIHAVSYELPIFNKDFWRKYDHIPYLCGLPSMFQIYGKIKAYFQQNLIDFV